MSLETNKSIALTGKSVINNNQVISLNATVDQQGNGTNNVTQTILNQALYDANKKEARADIAAFQDLVYDTQDQMDEEAAPTDTGSDTDTATDPSTDTTK